MAGLVELVGLVSLRVGEVGEVGGVGGVGKAGKAGGAGSTMGMVKLDLVPGGGAVVWVVWVTRERWGCGVGGVGEGSGGTCRPAEAG